MMSQRPVLLMPQESAHNVTYHQQYTVVRRDSVQILPLHLIFLGDTTAL